MASPFEEAKTEVDIAAVTNEIVKRLNEHSRRIKLMEQEIERIENKVGGIDEVVLAKLSDIKVGLEKMSQEISSTSERLNVIESEILRVNKGLEKAALKSDVKKIETFIDIVNPVTAKFVTKDELERALEERVKRKE